METLLPTRPHVWSRHRTPLDPYQYIHPCAEQIVYFTIEHVAGTGGEKFGNVPVGQSTI
jgi:hypothetical protein